MIAGIAEPVFDDEYVGAIEEEEDETGVVIPGTIAILGGGFIFCALLLAGLPPLSGFIAKFAIIDALLPPGGVGPLNWTPIRLLLVSGPPPLNVLTRPRLPPLW